MLHQNAYKLRNHWLYHFTIIPHRHRHHYELVFLCHEPYRFSNILRKMNHQPNIIFLSLKLSFIIKQILKMKIIYFIKNFEDF